jgi:hypothetical protein
LYRSELDFTDRVDEVSSSRFSRCRGPAPADTAHRGPRAVHILRGTGSITPQYSAAAGESSGNCIINSAPRVESSSMTPGVRVAVLMLVVLVSIAAAQRERPAITSMVSPTFLTLTQLRNLTTSVRRSIGTLTPKYCSYCQLGRRLLYRKLWRRSIQQRLRMHGRRSRLMVGCSFPAWLGP